MHDTAYRHGRLFFETYWRPEFRDIVELGSMNVNGSLRDHAPEGSSYVGLDMEPGPGVDVLAVPGDPIALPSESADVVVTSSCLEHDVCFWDTFLELIRLLRPSGLLYMNVPSNGVFHRFPVDCWRFYPDAGVALVEWARRKGVSVVLVESFVAKPEADGWADFISVFRKAGPGALTPRRIADQTAAQNIHHFGQEGLDREAAKMPGMTSP